MDCDYNPWRGDGGGGSGCFNPYYSQMNHHRLNEYMCDLERIDDIRDKLPCGDRRAEVGKIANRIREMLCEADGGISQGRNVENLLVRVRNLINVVLK